VSLITRKIDVQLKLNGDQFGGGGDTVTLTGLRCNATIHSFIGGTGGWFSEASIRISGMKNADMAKLSTLGTTANNYNTGTGATNQINILAGDDENGMNLIFGGAITSGNVDYNAMPDVGVDLVCNALTNLQMSPIAASSYKGAMSVASMIEAICHAASPPMAFVNNGVSSKLTNHAVAGSAKAQIQDICLAVGCFHKIVGAAGNQACIIWPAGSQSDDTVIDLGPDTGMVGYPVYSMRGINVISLYNSAIEVGRKIKVTSSIPAPAKNAPLQVPGTLAGQGPLQISGANGTFSVVAVTHNVVSQTPGGAWFTSAELTSLPYNAR
jgi:hypothetical protein